jgi:hypothetical protein
MIWILASDLDLLKFLPYVSLKDPKIGNETSKNIMNSSKRTLTKIPEQHEKFDLSTSKK